MSVKERAQRVRDRGAATRGVRNPELGSWSYDRYLWWLKQTKKEVPEQTDFCTYWRTVLLWVTGRKLRLMLIRAKKPLLWLAALVGAALVAYAIRQFWYSPRGFWHDAGQTVLVLIGVAWALLGVGTAVLVVSPLIPDKTAAPSEPQSRKEKLVLSALSVITLPVLIIVSALALIVVSTDWLHEKRVASRTLIWLLTNHFHGNRWARFRPIYVPLAVLVGLSFSYNWALVLVLILLGVACFLGAIAGICYLADRLKKRREVSLEKLLSVEEPYVTAEERYYVPPMPRQPSWLKRRLRDLRGWLRDVGQVVVEILSLVWAIIVTSKQRTCPIMILPTQPQLEGDNRSSGTVQG